jgi:cellulose synthase/poly-beta-1,6-N-acetylglucosamine synthase-like glycosyltransferase
MRHSPTNSERVSAIVPARNEEAVISGCVRSLAAQPEISEVLVVDDQSADRTAEIVRALSAEFPKVSLLPAGDLPAAWVGKNNAVWIGARESHGEWFLFTDADAVHEADSAARALEIAREQNAAMVSFSPEQVMETWYEKATIPYVYLRLGSRFRFEEVNDCNSSAAAANGQFILIRRDVYEEVGGHASVAAKVLEDVALAAQVKQAGHRIWFGSGKGIVRVRMYRSFAAMWEGWKKNLYMLMGGTPEALKSESVRALLPLLLAMLASLVVWAASGSLLWALGILATGLLGLLVGYGLELKRGGFSPGLLIYGIPGRILFAAVLWASYQVHRRGRLEWKGRAYPVDTPDASKG